VTRAAVLAVLVIAAGCGGSHPSAAQQQHHYFLVGKRGCARILRLARAHPIRPSKLGGIVEWTGSATYTASVNPARYPAKYRGDVVAGCQAAQ
jgi:hypothetical protein